MNKQVRVTMHGLVVYIVCHLLMSKIKAAGSGNPVDKIDICGKCVTSPQ